MRRRQVIAGLGAVIATCPSVARAQQPTMSVVGFLSSRSAADAADVAEPFRQGLKEAGYVEGQNVAIEYRWAEGRYELLAGFAADLVQRQVNVIAALAAPAPGLAAKAATGSIPIVFQTGSDPVKDGLVAGMNRPGGNVTGVSRLALNLGPKRLEILRELAPGARVIAVLVNPANRVAELQEFEIQEPARALGRTLIVLKASTAPGIDAAF